MVIRRSFSWIPWFIAAVFCTLSWTPPAAATDISAAVRAGDPAYRDLRLAAALGLLESPLSGQAPLSRAEIFRLLSGIPSRARETSFGTPGGAGVEVVPDPSIGLTPAVAKRLTRLRGDICPWDRFWEKKEYPITVWGSLARDVSLTYSEVGRGESAPRYLDNGYTWRQGLTLERDGMFFLEMEYLALDLAGRIRWDADALTYRPLVLTARTGFKNVRLIAGREPLYWGPGAHGSLLLTNNARPLDQLRLESASPFKFPWLFEHLGEFNASIFVSKLDDPHRSDVPDPWLTGLRLGWSPFRWLYLGANRTIMLGGQGNEFVLTWSSFWDVLFGNNENSVGTEAENDTDQKGAVEWGVYLWPLLQHVPVVKGGRIYGEYGGEDSPQDGPLPSAPGTTYGIELVAGGVLVRAESANVLDDKNRWYWHKIYTDGYTYRGRVMGHPMDSDSRSQAYDVEVPVGTWGLVTATMERQEHSFRNQPNPPVSTQDIFKLSVEKFLKGFSSVRAEVRYLREFGEVANNGPLEDWGITLGWRR